MHNSAVKFIMRELLTTDEAAEYLRVSERKLYELVAKNAVPCTKVTGKWLFPRAALNQWVAAGLSPASVGRGAAPPIVGGSHDPLLEWALRQSGCGLASLPEGSEEGLRRLSTGEIMIAAIHLHAVGDDEETNIATVANAPGLQDAVVIAFARREQGIIVAPGNPLKITDIASVAKTKARMAQRPPGAGAQLLLLAQLERAKLCASDLNMVTPICATGNEIAQAVQSGRADCGVAPRSAAVAANVEFIPLVWEYFDLVLRQRDYFLPGPQKLFGFLRSTAFAERAAEVCGYDIGSIDTVRLVN
jgi:putative molybdopterin biosynthesis protein